MRLPGPSGIGREPEASPSDRPAPSPAAPRSGCEFRMAPGSNAGVLVGPEEDLQAPAERGVADTRLLQEGGTFAVGLLPGEVEEPFFVHRGPPRRAIAA